MKYVERDLAGQVEILSRRDNLSVITRQIPATMGEVQEDGRKIAKAGRVFPANDGTAEGLIFTDVDVTYGDQPGAVMTDGFVYADRVEQVGDPAKAELRIVFE